MTINGRDIWYDDMPNVDVTTFSLVQSEKLINVYDWKQAKYIISALPFL